MASWPTVYTSPLAGGQIQQNKRLKLFGLINKVPGGTVRGQVPQKQGLKPYQHYLNHCWPHFVRGQVPQKQGLKPCFVTDRFFSQSVRGQVPQKQGLKQVSVPCQNTLTLSGPRASTTKKRLETREVNASW